MNLSYELNFTLRVLRKKLGFNALCILVIALGIAVSIPLYSLVRNMAYASLPFPDGERMISLVQVDARTNSELARNSFDSAQYLSLKEGSSSFDVLGAYFEAGVTFSDGDYAERFYGVEITAETLELAATVPVLGRSLLPSDQLPGAEPVILLGYDVWQNYYGGATDIVGKVSRVEGVPNTIIGVMPPGFKYPMAFEVWQPLTISSAIEPGVGKKFAIMGVLSEEASRRTATNEVQILMEQLAARYPQEYGDKLAKVSPFTHSAASDAFAIFNTVGGLAISIFLLVCLNVANLLTMRANERIEELAIRSAVGAGRLGLIVNVLLESLFICLIGTVLGVVTASVIIDSLYPFMLNLSEGGRTLPFWIDLRIDIEAIFVSLLLMFSLWFISGSLAAWRASGQNIGVMLGSDSKGATALRTGKFTRGMVLFQAVFSFFLLVVAGTFVFFLQKSYQNEYVDEVENYVSATISLAAPGYEDAVPREQYRQELKLRLIESIDQVQAASFTTGLPGDSGRRIRVATDGEIITDERPLARQYGIWVDNDYFQTMGFDLLQGRFFDVGDNMQSDSVVIVDDVFLSQFQYEESPIGRQIQLSIDNGETVTSARIIGVIARIGNERANNGDSLSTVYISSQQQSPPASYLVVKLNSDSASSLSNIERQIKGVGGSIDREISINLVKLLSEEVKEDNSEISIFISMFGGATFGVLILAIVGIYGLISRSVFARANEMGIRRAVGSSNLAIVKIFLGQGLFYIAAAVIVGGGGAILAVNLIQSLSGFDLYSSLFGVFVSVLAVVSVLIGCASYMPVRKVVALEPGEALHYE
ncbi:MAG: hypothetical protein COB20_10900 [SAR86 cluster bacterium]|uniref:ABC transporter permease n=1 Tax=SAR86 cluster bacterium TaxID=2030880 RepID=A0A2A4X1B5_9GAMM|nr:MAG: hypothetical protein COB20_10900 [SAR86 cluster bacterium]